MHIIIISFVYEDGKLSLDELMIDGANVLIEADNREKFKEFESFTLLDNLDFWDRLVARIKERIDNDDVKLHFDIYELPDLSYLADLPEDGCKDENNNSDARLAELISMRIAPAANDGCGYAQKLMGDYYSGSSVPSSLACDAVEEEKWYKAAAKHGLVRDLELLGECRYRYDKNYESAASCCREAAANGSLDAQALLALLYLKGLGVEQNEKKALELAEEAMRHPKCMYIFYKSIAAWVRGKCYESGANNSANPQKAFMFYQAAHDTSKEFAEAAFDLAWNYECGFDTEKDESMAFRLYHEAAEHGSVKALYALGYCYERGFGTKVDVKRAISFYKKAAKQGHIDAMDSLARCFENGIGVERDEKQAAKWREKIWSLSVDEAAST